MASTLSDDVYHALAKSIVAGELAPGRRLDEPSICSRFGVSRTPVREALRRLTGTGLVEIVPGRGVAVCRVGIDQLTDMFDALAELEGLCAKLSAERMTPLECRRLMVLNDSLPKKRASGGSSLSKLNEQFHDLIYAGAHNASLSETVRGFRQRLAPFQLLQFKPGATKTFDDHKIIVAAIAERRPIDAQTAMRDHVTRTSLQVIDHFAHKQNGLGESAAG